MTAKQRRQLEQHREQIGAAYRYAELVNVREVESERASGDKKKAKHRDLVADLSFSSETAVERQGWDGNFFEVLDHGKSSVRMERLRDNAPVLLSHDTRDQIGVVESAEIVDSRGRATVRFSENSRDHKSYGNIWQDVETGIRTKVSVGYRVHKAVLEEERDDGPNTYRITDWEPFEVSLVSTPADASVGIGRADSATENPLLVEDFSTMKGKKPGEPGDEKGSAKDLEGLGTMLLEAAGTMHRGEGEGEGEGEGATERLQSVLQNALKAAAGTGARSTDNGNNGVAAVADQKAERARIGRIQDTAAHFRTNMEVDDSKLDELERAAVRSGMSPDDFFAKAIEDLTSSEQINLEGGTREVGLTRKEVEKYSFFRACNLLAKAARGAVSPKDYEDAAFELEVGAAAAAQYKKEPRGLMIPDDILTARIFPMDTVFSRGLKQHTLMMRDLSKGLTGATGGNLIETVLDMASFIDILRARMVLRALGARTLDGLVGDLAIPRQTGGATAFWVPEATNLTESTPAYNQLTQTPHSMGGFVDVTRRMMVQTSRAAEALVISDLAAVLAREFDRVAIEGNPDVTALANEPRGILYTSGIGSVAIATAGGPPLHSHIVDLETEVAVDNADIGALAYLTNPKVRGKLKQTKLDTGSGQFVWAPNSQELNGYPVGMTTQVPSDLTKTTAGTNLSAILFGNFNDLILSSWTGVDLLVDPYTLGISGSVRIIMFMDVDVGVRHAESFSAVTDATTT